MSKNYEVAIIGSGIAGTMAALRIGQKHNDVKTIVFDIGAAPARRRRQAEGFLGYFPTGDGKIYPGDLEKVKDLVDGRKAVPAFKWVWGELFSQVNPMKVIKSKKPYASVVKKMKKQGFELEYHDFCQWKPKSVHDLSRLIAGQFEECPNLDFSFNNYVSNLRKNSQGKFLIETEEGSYIADKVIVCVGRSGWRWVTNLYDDLGIISNDDFARFGVRVEVPANILSDFRGSHMSFRKGNLEIGPLCWNGTVIQEDHSDLVISAFRSNEARWKTEKVSFSLVSSVYFKDQGSVQTDRIAKLAFLLFNDRVSKEKIKVLMKGNSQLNLVPEYQWVPAELEKLEEIMPGLLKRGSIYVPNIHPKPAEILIGSDLTTEIPGMLVAGEAAGVSGIMAAAVMGTVAADSACK